MKVDIKVPEVGESVQEAILAEWLKTDGEGVKKDEPVFVIETDKVTLEVPSPESGILEILIREGDTVAVGTVVGKIDTAAADQSKEEKKAKESAEEKPPEEKDEAAEDAAEEAPEDTTEDAAGDARQAGSQEAAFPPSVRRLAAEHDIDLSQVPASGKDGRITKEDVMGYLESEKKTDTEDEGEKETPSEAEPAPRAAGEEDGKESTTRKPMSPIRKTIARHLLAAKQNTAMLTTFNEIDMSRVKEIRERFKGAFYEKHGVRLGFMSFFVKASVAALQAFPAVNGRIDKDDIVYHHYYNIGIAIGSERGLVVPVIRHADRLGFAQIESQIIEFAEKVQKNRLSLADLEGGTFSITNGGIYGSLMSTPILNPPQSAILGMHKIEDRPVALAGQVVIRPMMYVAVSYDHRIVDGKDAVTFLQRIKEFVENPERILMEI